MEPPGPTNPSSSSAAAESAATKENSGSMGDAENADERLVARILSEANVNVAEMDPISLQALRAHVRLGAVKAGATAGVAGADSEPTSLSSHFGGSGGDGAAADNDSRMPSTIRIGGSQFSRGPSGTLSRHLTSSELAAIYASRQSRDDRILQHLEEQTRVLLELHERVTQLSSAVSTMTSAPHQQIIGGPHITVCGTYHAGNEIPGRQQRAMDGGAAAPAQHHAPQQAPEVVARANAPLPLHAQIQGAAPGAAPPPPPPNLVVLPLLGNLFQRVAGIPDRLRNSRPARIVRLYLALRRRQVPDLDVATLFKVLFMMAILMARLSRGTNSAPPKPLRFPPDGSLTLMEFLWEVWRQYRLHVAATLIVAGFLVQSGYARFLYNFVVKEDYPGRIWNGEDLDVEQVLREQEQRARQQQQQPPPRGGPGPEAPRRDAQPPPAQQGNIAAAANGGAPAQPQAPAEAAGPAAPQVPQPQLPGGAPMGYVVGGQVPRPDDDPDEDDDDEEGEGRERRRMPATIRFVVEVGYLLSSFVLSIFPMWQPVAMEPPAPRRPAEDGPAGDDGQRQDGPRHLPQVQPPRDPAEYDDEEDDEEYDDEEGEESDEE